LGWRPVVSMEALTSPGGDPETTPCRRLRLLALLGMPVSICSFGKGRSPRGRVYHGPMATTRAIAALFVLMAVLAGCGGGGGGGGGSKPVKGAAYVERVDAISNQLDKAASSLSSALSASASPAAELATARSALRRTANELAAITPPPEIKASHERLVAAVNQLADDVTPLIKELETGNLDNLDTGSLKGESEARAAIAEIVKAGYKIQVPLLS
jgi:cob(I)alamin adenosyltransferase